jgi:CRP-like cAMP-binding protein
MLTVVEKVLLLQDVEVFADVTGEQLSLVAAIADERTHDAGDVLYSEGEPADAMFVVVRGALRLHQGHGDIAVLGVSEAFGTWALLEDEPRLTSATVTEPSVLLRIDRADFIDVLADHVELTRAVLSAVARRLRALLGSVGRP